eukprot:CAMPEP_0202397642 /NCGR_PEP_ID=MMETSP1128-20130828/711_1 /ASSEMBLY_ACC=CAM_ASM_000463 /TAXON_ID=3047 /ORGANISM="Dunaliella tertiolecta, Strain CCMP1320" /LENGTH=74 /DNA_ID=CAMNT_0049000591 /DNA_START=28 /DNA_END=250 /DNA_ORIENTATION=+
MPQQLIWTLSCTLETRTCQTTLRSLRATRRRKKKSKEQGMLILPCRGAEEQLLEYDSDGDEDDEDEEGKPSNMG